VTNPVSSRCLTGAILTTDAISVTTGSII
jgi:hypothetical protein